MKIQQSARHFLLINTSFDHISNPIAYVSRAYISKTSLYPSKKTSHFLQELVKFNLSSSVFCFDVCVNLLVSTLCANLFVVLAILKWKKEIDLHAKSPDMISSLHYRNEIWSDRKLSSHRVEMCLSFNVSLVVLCYSSRSYEYAMYQMRCTYSEQRNTRYRALFLINWTQYARYLIIKDVWSEQTEWLSQMKLDLVTKL